MTTDTTEFDRSRYIRLKQAVEALAAICDGAEARDDEGFDGTDSKAGHLFAFLPLDAWPLSAFHRAWKWTKKYHRQLGILHIDCTDLPEPPLFEGEDRQIACLSDRSGFFVTFPYDGELIPIFQGIPGSALHSHPIGRGKQFFRYRTVQLVQGISCALLTFAEQYRFQLAPGVEELARASDGMVAHLPSYRIAFDSMIPDAFTLFFPRNNALNEEIKRIPGKAPSFTDGFHWVIPATPLTARLLLEFFRRHPQFFVPTEVEQRLHALTR